jgi:hypothetical protein
MPYKVYVLISRATTKCVQRARSSERSSAAADWAYQPVSVTGYLQFWDAKRIEKTVVFRTSRNPMASFGYMCVLEYM